MMDSAERALLQSGLGSIKPYTCPELPTWMLRAIQGNVREYDPNMAGENDERVTKRTCGSGSLMQTIPNYDGEAEHVQRVRGLNASEFYRRFPRRGLPVVLEGAIAPAVRTSALALTECLADEYARKAAAHGFRADDACDRYGGWCRDGVQISSDPICIALAGFTVATVPPELAAVIELPRPLPDVSGVAMRMAEPFVLWTPPGGTFGKNDHFDQLCANTFSMQYQGTKRWTLWAPWELPGAGSGARSHIRAHTRFEALVRPGDVLFYPPAWFHATVVEEGDDSITAACDLERYPAFGATALVTPSQQEPIGFGACEGDWRRRSDLWDRVLLPGGGGSKG